MTKGIKNFGDPKNGYVSLCMSCEMPMGGQVKRCENCRTAEGRRRVQLDSPENLEIDARHEELKANKQWIYG